MSHILDGKNIPIRNLAALKETCAVNSWSFMEGQRTHKWYGRWVGDTPMPAGLKVEDLGKCDHAIRVPGCAYEIGVRDNHDGTYSLLYDYFSAGGLSQALGGDTLPKLAQSYATEMLKMEHRRLGGAVESQDVMADGSVRLRLLAVR